jgi:uncharacterized membrane protein
MKKHTHMMIACVLMVLFTGKFKAQLSGVYNIPGDYVTIGAAINDLNIFGVTGAVTVNIAAGHTETATVGGYTLNSIVGASSINQVTFRKNGAGANPLITAYTGTATPASAQQDGVWRFLGTDFVTIDGVDITDPNTANPATMEFGYGFFKVGTIDGCQNNTIRNCNITLNRINNATGSGPASAGSRGIDVVNANVNAHITALTISSALGSNSNNKFYSNTISNCNIGIAIVGFAASTPFTLGDTGNDIGGSSVSTGNTILNFGGTGAVTTAQGILTSNQWNLNVSFNIINNNNGSGSNHTLGLAGISVGAATSANATINSNTVTLQAAGTTQLVQGIVNASGSSAASNTITMNNNLVTNCVYTVSSTSAVFNAILNSGTPAVLRMNNNMVSNIQLRSTGIQVLLQMGSPVLGIMNSNTVTNITNASATTGNTRLLVMLSPTDANIDGNLIDGVSYTNVASTGNIDGIYGFSSAVNVNISNNIVRNLSTPTTGAISGIREFGISGNKIVSNNQIFNFTTTSGGSGGNSYNGISLSTGSQTITGNQIYNLNSTGSTGGTGGTIHGIANSGGTSSLIHKNKIYNLSSTSTAPTINGISMTGGTTNTIQNNLIGDLRATAASAASPVNGINITGGTTNHIFYNSVFLAATSTGANFGSSAISVNTSPTSVNIRNNIFVNNSVPNGTGLTVAHRRSSTTLTNYATTSNNNLFYAGTPAANSLIYHDGTNAIQTLGAYQTLMVNRDLLSVTENPPFASITGTATNFLNLNSTPATLAESGASGIPGINDDYAGNPRNPSASDIGAWEGNFLNVNPPCSGTPLSGTAAISSSVGCPNTLFNLSVSGHSSFVPGISYQWQSSSSPTGPWSNIAGATGASFQTSLTATTYYQFVVTCTASASSATTGVVSYSVAGDVCACTAYPNSAATNTNDDEIFNVTLGTLNNTSNCLTTAAGPGSVNKLYSNYAGIVAAPTLQAGTAHGMSVTVGQCNTGSYSGFVQVWIDFNNNGSFLDAGENVWISPNTLFAIAGTMVSSNINIPVNVTPGIKRMRVLMVESTTTVSPHTTYGYGETEDYCIDILPPVLCAGAPASGTAAINVSSGCANQAVTLTGLGLTTGVGITYQWQSASTLAGPYTAVAGATNATLPQTVSVDSYYRIVTTCSGSGLTATSSPIGYLVNTCAGSFTLTDSYGDGWNGATMNLVVGSSTFALGSGFTAGSSQVVNLCLPATSNFTLFFGSPGAYATEVGITASIGGSIVTTIVGLNSGGPLEFATTNSVLSTGATCPNCSSASGGTLATSASTVCTTGAGNLLVNGATSAGGITYAWQTAPTSGGTYSNVSVGSGAASTAYSTPTLLPGTYFYRLQTTCNGSLSAVSNEATLTVLALNAPSFSTSAPAACNGGSVALIGTGAINYTWSTGATGNSIAITPTASAFYFVTGGNGFCPNVTTSQTPVYYSLNPNVTATSASTVVCAGIQATLTGAGAATYSWTDGSNNLSGTTINPTPTVATTYTVTGYKTNGCNNTATITMPVNPAPNISFSGSSGICTGQTATIIASGANSYTWNTGSNSSSITITPPTGTNVYTVTGESALGCKAVATQTLNVAASLSISIAGPNAICIGDAVNLTGQGGVTYTWNTSATTQTITDSPTTTTTYSIIGASGTCSNTAVKTVTVNSIPVVSVVGNNTICVGQTASLTASGANTYSWTTTTTGATVGVFPPSTAMYTVYGTSTANCTGNQTVMVTVNPLPTVSIASSAASVCVSSPASFTASGANTYSWVNGPTTPDYTVTPTAAAVYTVIGTSTAGCVSSRTVALGSYTLPVVSIAPSSASICLNSLGTFVASGASTYTWNASPTNTSATFTVVPSGNTVYTVVASTTAGCIGSQTVGVTSYSLPAMIITPPSATICANSFTSFVASGAVTYTWTNGPQTAAYNFFHTTSITHTVTGTNPEGCKASETVAVLANPLPTLVSVPAFTTVCANSNVNFSASGADTYTWNSGAATGSNVSITTPTASTTYTLAGTNSFGCSSSTVVPIIVNALPVVNITPATATVCSLSSVNFTASGANSYTWNGTVFTATVSLTPTLNSTYTVVATNTTTGCQNSKTVSVVANALPSLTITPSAASVCVGSDATLNVSGATTYTWGDGSNATTLTVTPNGTSNYSVTGVNQNGCVSSKSISVGNYALPTLVLTPAAQTVCLGETGSYTVSGATTYTWEPGALSGTEYTASPLTTSFYTVTGKDANNCVNALSFILTIDKCTGIKESAINSDLIKLFPNPSNGIITADFGFEGVKNVMIMSSTGAVITNHTTLNQTETFDLSALSKGVYFIRVSSKQASGNYKVVVQ